MTEEHKKIVEAIESDLKKLEEVKKTLRFYWKEEDRLETSIHENVWRSVLLKEIFDRILDYKGKYIRTVFSEDVQIIRVESVRFEKHKVELIGSGPRMAPGERVYQAYNVNIELYNLGEVKDLLDKIEIISEDDLKDLDRIVDESIQKQIDTFTKTCRERADKMKKEIREYLGEDSKVDHDDRLRFGFVRRDKDLLYEVCDISLAALKARLDGLPDPEERAVDCIVDSGDNLPKEEV